MTKTDMLNTPAFIVRRNEIFMRFALRGKYIEQFIKEETIRLMHCTSEMDYLRVHRTGSKYPLNLGAKRSVYSLWESANNHASVEFE
jgi:hypothetical protein